MADATKHKENNARTENNSKSPQVGRDISIWLDDYDDIFSDFDPRPYSERTLSDDFLSEMTKVYREGENKINELRLLLPEKIRNKETEGIITKRLHGYFKKNLQNTYNERKNIVTKGILFFISGTLLLGTATYVSQSGSDKLISSILLVTLEPAGWFMVWMGLDNMFSLLKKKKYDFDFYTKMGKSKVVFSSI